MKFFGILLISTFIGILSLSHSLFAQELETEDSFVAAVEAELQNDRYQTTLPGPEQPDQNNYFLPDWVGPILKVIFLVMLILLGVFLIYQLARYWGERNQIAKRPKEKNLKPVRAFQIDDAEISIPTIADAEKKAEEGQYQEAIHLLLLIAIHRMFVFINAPVPEAKTSREILREGAIFERWGGDLGYLVRAVEDSLFAGNRPGQPQYMACRKSFDRLTSGLEETR